MLLIPQDMLTIRPEQYAVFSQAANKRLKTGDATLFCRCGRDDELRLNLQDRVASAIYQQCNAMGEPQLRETIQYGIQRATAYGIVGNSDVCKYIDLMVVFGRDFDTAPRFPWAAEILTTSKNPSVKSFALLHVAKKYLRER